jgi:predicted DNA-binding protein (MmcQ/YjbR family)
LLPGFYLDRKGRAFPHIQRQRRNLNVSYLRNLRIDIMDVEQVHSFCLSFPHVTEEILWGNDLVFKIGGKMFAVIGLDPVSRHRMSFKCTPEKFAELVERAGIVPAPYVARYHWVALERFNAVSERELKALLRTAYDLVLEKLTKRARASLVATPKKSPPKRR